MIHSARGLRTAAAREYRDHVPKVVFEIPFCGTLARQFISFEPLLDRLGRIDLTAIDWVILGVYLLRRTIVHTMST